MSTIYLVAKSEKAIEALRTWRDDLLEANKAWRDYTNSIGAESFLQFSSFDRPSYFAFPRHNCPDGWIKPFGKHDASRPKQSNKAAQAEIDALPSCRPPSDVAAVFGLPTSVHWNTGFSRLGRFWDTWQIGWTDDVLYLAGPDLAEARLRHGEEEGFAFNVGNGDLPLADFDVVSKAQIELLHAQAAVRVEATA